MPTLYGGDEFFDLYNVSLTGCRIFYLCEAMVLGFNMSLGVSCSAEGLVAFGTGGLGRFLFMLVCVVAVEGSFRLVCVGAMWTGEGFFDLFLFLLFV